MSPISTLPPQKKWTSTLLPLSILLQIFLITTPETLIKFYAE